MANAARAVVQDGISSSARSAVIASLRLLHEEWRKAEASPGDREAFAVEVDRAGSKGIPAEVLRLLVSEGLVEQQVEPTHTRCALSERGLSMLGLIEAVEASVLEANGTKATSNGKGRSRKPRPRWDRDRRELWVGDVQVKRFRVPAQNEEAILTAFQRARWRKCLDNPLSQSADRAKSLHDAVFRLNNNQLTTLLRFHVLKHGTAVRWELLERNEKQEQTEATGPSDVKGREGT